ncbi:hypothetical protein E1264_09760 [Actinomadura sp. KC216]|uniref:hypothetical protein n=1 Tax=Actinomadura sp. KC216 TaxID=2530370 RepID=UPI001045FDB2|nr:hypothetical protein [Actinomadura sp. KC216]TDB88966.1 hypothetical protein E1264_09760 [Actinomadura sp. KC216]
MKRASLAVTVLAGVGAIATRRLLVRSRQAGTGESRWLVVTVNCPPERLSELPEPLALLGDEVETRVAAAPGDRGTELAARISRPGSPGLVARLGGADSRQAVRSALRDAKSLLETGEVLRPDSPPTTRPTVRGKVVELATRRAAGEGRL